MTHFKVTAKSGEKTDTRPRSVGVRAKEGQRSLSVRSVGKTSWSVLDTKLHVISQRFIERRMDR